MTTDRIRIYPQEGLTGLMFIDFKPSIGSALRWLHPPLNALEWRISSLIEPFPEHERTPCACGEWLSHRVIVITHQESRISLLVGECCLLGAE